MKKIITTAGIALLVLAVHAAPAMAQANVAGMWTITIEGPEGPAEASATLVQDGATFTGEITMAEAEGAEIANGTVEGNTMKFQLVILMQGAEIALEVEGQVDGDNIAGEMYVPDFGGFPFSAVRT